MSAHPQKEWARVRHVVVSGERSDRWSLRPWLSATLLVPAVVMLINAHGGFQRSEMMPARAAVAYKVVEVKATLHSHAIHPGLHGAEAKGLVQAVRAHSEAATKHNIATDALTAEPANFKGNVPSAGNVATQAKSKLAAGKEPDNNKVVLKMYMESECPACRKFSTTYVKEILNAKGVGDVVDFKIVPWGWGVIQESPTEKQLELNPKADYSDNVLNRTAQLLPILRSMENPRAAVPSLLFQCQHGFSECEGNAYESCLQDVAPAHEAFFPVLDCVEARSCAENMKPPDCVDTPANVMQGCLEEYGKHINTPELLECYHGDRMRQLLVMNDIATLQAKPQWVPWFTVDGVDLVQDPDNKNTTASFREQFLLGKKICDVYVAKTGKEAPPGCASFPENDEQVGVDPWERFPKLNFTNFILEQKKRAVQTAAAEQALRVEQASPWRFFKVKLLLVVAMIFMAGGGCYWCISKSKQESGVMAAGPASVGKEEHV